MIQSSWKKNVIFHEPIIMQKLPLLYDFEKAFNTFPYRILDFSKLKEFADINFKFDENGRNFSKRVQNTVGKGEISRYKQFLFFP